MCEGGVVICYLFDNMNFICITCMYCIVYKLIYKMFSLHRRIFNEDPSSS